MSCDLNAGYKYSGRGKQPFLEGMRSAQDRRIFMLCTREQLQNRRFEGSVLSVQEKRFSRTEAEKQRQGDMMYI